MVLAATVAAFAATPSAAQTSQCGLDEQIFQRGDYGVRGTQNDIRFKERTQAPCDDQTNVLSTAHVRLTPDSAGKFHYVEVGWRGNRNFQGVQQWEIFTHWVRNGLTRGGGVWTDPQVPATCLNDPQDDRWKVANSFGTSTWFLEVDCFDGIGWRQVPPTSGFQSTGDTTGIAMGETEKYGCTGATGMAELQRNLKRRINNGTWVAWSQNVCHWDDAANWKSTSTSATAYITELGSDSCDGLSPC